MLVVAAITPIAMTTQGLRAAVGDAAQDLDLSRAERALREKVRALRARNGAEGTRRIHRALLVVVRFRFFLFLVGVLANAIFSVDK